MTKTENEIDVGPTATPYNKPSPYDVDQCAEATANCRAISCPYGIERYKQGYFSMIKTFFYNVATNYIAIHRIPVVTNVDATNLAAVIHVRKGRNVRLNWFAMNLILISLPLVSNPPADKVRSIFILIYKSQIN